MRDDLSTNSNDGRTDRNSPDRSLGPPSDEEASTRRQRERSPPASVTVTQEGRRTWTTGTPTTPGQMDLVSRLLTWDCTPTKGKVLTRHRKLRHTPASPDNQKWGKPARHTPRGDTLTGLLLRRSRHKCVVTSLLSNVSLMLQASPSLRRGS